jgi:hypothetical protein
MIHVCLQAAQKLEKDGVQAEVLDLRSLRPLDVDAILRHGREDEPRGATWRRAGRTAASPPDRGR